LQRPRKGIGEILFGVGGDDDHGPVLGGNGFINFDDVELHLIEHVQHVVLEIRVGLVDLVDESTVRLSAVKACPILPILI
jgi:hypothetical protein